MELEPLTAPGDPSLKAPVITSTSGFPRSVLRDRHPELLAKVLNGVPYPPEIRATVNGLAEEIEGPILPLSDTHADAAQWAAWAAPYLGRTWYEVPFLWAESYFYRRLLEAVGYFAPGAWYSAVILSISSEQSRKFAAFSGVSVTASQTLV